MVDTIGICRDYAGRGGTAAGQAASHARTSGAAHHELPEILGLASDQVLGSRLGETTEASYRSPDMDRARSTEA